MRVLASLCPVRRHLAGRVSMVRALFSSPTGIGFESVDRRRSVDAERMAKFPLY